MNENKKLNRTRKAVAPMSLGVIVLLVVTKINVNIIMYGLRFKVQGQGQRISEIYLTIMHIESKRRPIILVLSTLLQESTKVAHRQSAIPYLLKLRSSIARLPSCLCRDTALSGIYVNQKFGAKPNVSPPGARSPIGGNQKGCLLYTSPSPRDRQKSRMPSSA